MNRCVSLAICSLFACYGVASRADTVTLTSARDNTLYQDAAGLLSNGAGEFMFAGMNNNALARRGLLYFNVAGVVPAGATINSATLSMHVSQAPSATARNIDVRPVLTAWGEGTSNATAGGGGAGTTATPGDATWLHTFSNTSFWAQAGGDFGPASATSAVGAVGFYSWTSPQIALDVQSWLNHPASNFGWGLVGDEINNQSVKRFDTHESATASFRPQLTINYTPVPEPSTGALVALCGAALLAWRRGRKHG